MKEEEEEEVEVEVKKSDHEFHCPRSSFTMQHLLFLQSYSGKSIIVKKM
jgi:hypothetical protein